MKANLKLKLLRKRNKLTAKDMAIKIGISQSHYSLIENNKRRLYYDIAVKIALIFHLKPDDIFYEK